MIECILKSAPDQLRTVSPADPVADNHARVQVKNYTNIIVFAVCSEASHVANPYFIWTGSIKLLVECIFELPFIFFYIEEVNIFLRTMMVHMCKFYSDKSTGGDC